MLENSDQGNKTSSDLHPQSLPKAARPGSRCGGLLGIFIVATLFFAGCGSKKEEAPEEAPTVTVQVATAEKEPIQRKVIADATIYARDQAAIVPKVTSPVAKFFVDRGAHVHAGELLAELENKDLVGAQVKSAAGTQQAEAAYQTAVQKAQQDLALAKVNLDNAQKLYDSRQALYKERAVSAKDVDDAAAALTQAKNQYDLAQKQGDVKVAEAQLAAAKADTESAAATLDYTKITSPINGVVTDRPYFAGETPAAGAPLITVMDLSEVVARAHVSQQNASSVKAGDPATISVPGGTTPDLKGKVTMVSPALDPNSTTIEVWVQATNPGERLKAGTNASVTIVAETVQGAVVIPAPALLTEAGGETSVITLDAKNVPHKTKVEVGIRSDDDVQITKGLDDGERVVTVGAFELDKEDEDVLAKTKIVVQAPEKSDDDEKSDQQEKPGDQEKPDKEKAK